MRNIMSQNRFLFLKTGLIVIVAIILIIAGFTIGKPATEPQPSNGYTIYDTFDVDNGTLKIVGNRANCPTELGDGKLKIECFGSAAESVDLTLSPVDTSTYTPRGVEMAFYTLPLLERTNLWGKYHIQMLYGSQCQKDKVERAYYISVRPNELTFVEADGNHNSVNPPSPTRAIGTLRPHVIKIELENGKVNYYFDNSLIRTVVPLPNTGPVCWMLQSEDNDNLMADGYRGIVILWIATKP